MDPTDLLQHGSFHVSVPVGSYRSALPQHRICYPNSPNFPPFLILQTLPSFFSNLLILLSPFSIHSSNMSLDIVHHFAKRAVKSGLDCMTKGTNKMGHGGNFNAFGSKMTSQNPDQPLGDIVQKVNNPAAIIVFGITFLVYLALSVSIEYAIRYVATGLAIIEDDETNGAIKLPAGDEAAAPLIDEYDATVETGAISQKPITSGIRSTFKYLSSTHGFFSRWRGLGNGIFYGVIFMAFSSIFTAFLSFIPVLGFVIGRLAAGMITCNLHAAWTHAIIATKSERPFFQSFLSRGAAKHLMLPTARNQFALMSMGGVAIGLANATQKVVMQRGATFWAVPILSLLTMILPLIIFFFVVIPSHIALIRSEASLLPEDRSAIVPFDATFGGRIAWKELDSRKAYFLQNISLKGAYKTFDKRTYMRVVKMSVKLTAIMFGLGFIFAAIFIAEFFAFAKKVDGKA
jgi:hypothetical protein